MQKPLPEGWKWVKLGEVFDITSSKRVFESDWKREGVPFYRAREIVKLARHGFVDNDLFISEDMYSQYSTKYGIPAEGDIMVTGVGTLGICYVVQKSDRFYFKDGNIIWLKKRSQVDSRFVEYAFKSDFLRKQIDDSPGATVGTFTIVKAKNTLIPLPPLPTQRKIVEILEEADNLRKLRQQADEKMNDLTPSLFVQMFGDPATNPKGWEMKKLGEVANIRRGASPRPMGDPRYFGGTIPWIRISDIHRNGKFLNDTEDHVTEEGAKRSVYLKSGSLIMAMAASIGTPCFLAVDGCIHDGFVVFEELSPKLDKEFLYYFLTAFKYRFVSLAPEGTQKNLNTALIKAVTLPLPPLPLQQEFATLVEDIEAEKARQAESRKKLYELFNSLMQRAFTGASANMKTNIKWV